MPFYTMFLAFVWSSVNAYLQGRYFSALGPIYASDYLTSSTFLLGTTIFFIGMSINIHSDRILTNLRYDPLFKFLVSSESQERQDTRFLRADFLIIFRVGFLPSKLRVQRQTFSVKYWNSLDM